MGQSLRSGRSSIAVVAGALLIVAPAFALGGPSLDAIVLASEGEGDFQTVVVTSCSQARLPRGGTIFWRALDWTPDGQTLFGVSDDELYQIDPASGDAELVGEIVFSAGGRFRFRTFIVGTPATIVYAEPGAAGPVIWNLRATVFVSGYIPGSTEVFEFTINRTGIIPDGAALGDFIDETLEIPDTLTVRLRCTFTADGIAEVLLSELDGDGYANIVGTFTVIRPNAADAEPLTLAAAGLSIDPNGDIYMLSDPESDPFGDAAIYQLDLSGPDVVADFVTVPDAPGLHAIEFADDGRLFGAGSDVVLIDPIMGWTVPLAALGSGDVIELDYGPDDRLYAISREIDGRSALRDATPGPDAGSLLARLGATPYWGLAVQSAALGDLDLDGDVDVDDAGEYAMQYTGSLAGPYVPPGVPEPPLPDALPVPSSVVGAPDVPAVYHFDAVDFSTPGVVVEGTPTDRANTSAALSLIHSDTTLEVTVQVTDDQALYTTGAMDVVELYLDANNSDLPVTEGDPTGFQATMDSERNQGGDPGAFGAWSGSTEVRYRPGYRVEFDIDMGATGMLVGGTYGFDLGIIDTDRTGPGQEITTHYFFFSTDAAAYRDERFWGDIHLAPGPLAEIVGDPMPTNGALLVDADTNLSWASDPGAAAHRVYFGADLDALVYQGEQVATGFSPGLLSTGTTYFWRVDEVNSNGVRTGWVWRFTTALASADVDRDGDVDEHDARRMFQRPLGDANGDGAVDGADYQQFVAALGAVDGEPAYDALVDYDSDGQITLDDYGIWMCHYLENGNAVFGDLDADGDRDMDDYARFVDCMTGPVMPVSVACFPADFNVDDHVDLADAAVAQTLFLVELP